MGTINVDGLGIVEIKGSNPDEQEQEAILNYFYANEDNQEPISQEQPTDELAAQDTKTPEVAGEGPLGVVSPETRESVRGAIENQPGLMQLIAEISPSAIGAFAGATAGTPFGPPGMIAGGMIGGTGGEFLAQETGIAPTSDLNLALAVGGPAAGPAAGGMFRLGRRVIGAIPSILPFARTARARNLLPKAIEEYESLGTHILGKQKGLMARPSSELYDAVRRSGVIVPPGALGGTRTAIEEMLTEMKALKAFPEIKQSMKILGQITKTIGEDTDISMDTLVRTRQLVGVVIRRAESGGGVKLGSSKQVFKAISDDLDRIANDPSLTGRAARLAKTAVQRAKLEFSVKDFEAGIARYVKDTSTAEGGDMVTVNVNGIQKWLRDVTNPKSKLYDKNFTSSLKDELPEIKDRLTAVAKILGGSGSGGTGSLVIRGRLTSAMVGALAGMGFGGPIGGAVGALIGTRIPEMLTGILTTKRGSAFLERAVRLGKGKINTRAWILAGEIATRSLGEKNESTGALSIDPKAL